MTDATLNFDGKAHIITLDSYQDPLPTPLRVEVVRAEDRVAFILQNAAGEEVGAVHLEVDAALGGKVILRAWDQRSEEGSYGEPFITEELDLEEKVEDPRE